MKVGIARHSSGKGVRLRLGLSLAPLSLVAAGFVGWYVQDDPPVVLVGPSPILSDVSLWIGDLAFWAAACILMGIVGFVFLLVVPDLTDVTRWSSLVLVTLWICQVAALAGLYVVPYDSTDAAGTLWVSRPTSLYVRWQGLVLLLLTFAGVTVWSRAGRSRLTPTE